MKACDQPKAKTSELLSQYLPAMQRLELKRQKEEEDACGMLLEVDEIEVLLEVEEEGLISC